MPIINRIAGFQEQMTDWRQDIHAHPEIAFQENRTSDLVAEQLESFGIEVNRGLAQTGVVGVLKNGDGPSIGLRADMDALPLQELNTFAHTSKNDGKMHACGHDGHTAMLLGAAKYLSETKNFKGTVNFIFQPAEEGEGGGRVMVEEGLFDKFPCESVYGLHNKPGLDVGTFAVRSGPSMASMDTFDIKLSGFGAHAAMPHQSIDPIVIASQIVIGLQSIVSRTLDANDAAVLSVTQVHSGSAMNVIPDDAYIGGTVRCFSKDVQDFIEKSIEKIASGIAEAHGGKIEFEYQRRYPALVNHEKQTEIAAEVAREIVGNENVNTNMPPVMGSEDFSFLLNERPGSFLWIGNGPGEGDCTLHNPHYDFNDEILGYGATFFTRMVESQLPSD